MGQKVHPFGFRLGYIRDWSSKWYSKDGYQKCLLEDLKIKRYLKEELKGASVGGIEISRTSGQVKVTVLSAKPWIAIGKKGAGVDKIRRKLTSIVDGSVLFNILEIKRPDACALLLAENVAQQLEKRIAYRRAMKKVMQSAFRAGVKGVKIKCSGRLGGAEMARDEGYSERKIPLHTIRADIDYGTARASTAYGIIGVKVWVYKGEIYK